MQTSGVPDAMPRSGYGAHQTTGGTVVSMDTGRPISEFTEDELRDYACEHVLYEITHFVRAAEAVEAAHAGRFPMNFALEVFALHLRNLLDFFAPRSPRPRATDACARHFHATWEPPELNRHLTQARWMADKHIAHLTTDRTADIDLKTWAVEPIVNSLTPIIQRFADGADLVRTTFRERVAERLAELPRPGGSGESPPGRDAAPRE